MSSAPAAALPHLRPDAAVLAPPCEPVSIALSPHSEVLITSPPAGLTAWLDGLDGTSTWDDQLAAAPLGRREAASLLRQLRQAGVLLDADRGRVFRDRRHTRRDALALAADARGAAAQEPEAAPSRVGILGTAAMAAALASAVDGCHGLVRADPPACDLAVLVTDAFDQRAADRADALLSQRIPSVCLQFSAVDAALSPTTVPGRTACWRCWMLDVGNRRTGARERLVGGAWVRPGRTPSAPRLPSHHGALVAAVALEHVLRSLDALAGRTPFSSTGTERLIDLRRLTIAERTIRIHPACGCEAATA